MGIEVTVTREFATVTLRFPERRNALGAETSRELAARIGEAGEAAPVVILAGEGAFCAGGDLKAYGEKGGTPEEVARRIRTGAQAAIRALRDCRRPTIAAVDGPAIGLGMDLALACDMCFVGPDGWLMQGWGRAGLIPGTGGVILTGRRRPGLLWRLLADQPRLDGPACEAIGLAEEAPGGALAAAEARAEALAPLPDDVLAGYVALDRPERWPSDEHLDRCADLQGGFLASERFREGVQRLLERSP